MQDGEILISGASVAGCAAAFWLRRRGFRPTVVERAPGLRRGGQAIDVRGVALEVMEQMGLLEAARSARTGTRGMSFVDAAGVELMRTTEETLTGGRTDSPDIELMRDDLVALLHEPTRGEVEYLFDDSIVAIEEGGGGVTVRFERAPARRFALVIGADGLHSNVRRHVFGEEAAFVHGLGIQLAVFTAPNVFGLDHWQVFHRGPQEMVGIYTARDNLEVRAMLGCESPSVPVDHRDVEAQKASLEARFADVGWEAARLLGFMRSAPDFHCDVMAQVRMETWSKGRVVLLGDAGYCSSPMSGQGTSLAIVGAYVLAGELAAASGDPARAFAAYERRMRPFVAENQALALGERDGPPEPEVLQRAARSIELPDYDAIASAATAA